MKRILLPLFILALVFVYVFPAVAAPKPKKPAAPSIAMTTTFNKPKNTVNAYFGNLKKVKKVTYTLMYDANGIGQGVEGSFVPGKKKAISKSFYLGTCSGRVCTKHRNINDIRLEVVTKFTNGKSSKKVIRVK
ncbi:MAG: hypothetical protein HY428_01840 [Candidatus Levybacteria bacterium]|nr:hypothetical protein [Candidatus Levybacteria bacterium]